MRWSLWGGGEGVDGIAGGEGLAAGGFGFAALFGMEDEDAAGDGGDAGGLGRDRMDAKKV